MKPIETLMSRS